MSEPFQSPRLPPYQQNLKPADQSSTQVSLPTIRHARHDAAHRPVLRERVAYGGCDRCAQVALLLRQWEFPTGQCQGRVKTGRIDSK